MLWILTTLGARLGVLFDMEQQLPSRPGELAYRWELAGAIVAVTDDAWERRQLTKLARYESDLRESVGRCIVLGHDGDRGPWQVIARTAAERVELCESLEQSGTIALERIHESVGACRWLPPEERLAVYARGSCLSAEGRRLSRIRWAE